MSANNKKNIYLIKNNLHNVTILDKALTKLCLDTCKINLFYLI